MQNRLVNPAQPPILPFGTHTALNPDSTEPVSNFSLTQRNPMMTRREALKTTVLATAACATTGVIAQSNLVKSNVVVGVNVAAGPFTLPPLPYAYDALEPHIDTMTMQIHHDKHHQAYIPNLNAAV